ncbi:hypothetical protein LCM23_14590 [Cytobacillus kochii]|uniref:hypothetical protein n=1 Tax=Cytobacillus kochii TaxID=859143 RepID=UPI001CD36C04|nr:hypothetical protein [Cytobacillus kochii]MCA1027325.1 hypothetical protein [Cytobacillus kochii]
MKITNVLNYDYKINLDETNDDYVIAETHVRLKGEEEWVHMQTVKHFTNGEKETLFIVGKE